MFLLKRLFAVAGLVIIAGCGSSSGGNQNAVVLGTWIQATIAQDGSSTLRCPANLVVGGAIVDSCGTNDTIVFNANGTFTQTVIAGSSSGTYNASGNTLTLTYTIKNGVTQNPALIRVAHFTVTNATLSVRPLTNGSNFETGETLTFGPAVTPL
ncbi:MAG: lipocalin family protein [Chthonomonadales bacterium]